MAKQSVPILFTVFNRKDTAEKVFDQIKRYKPKHLFVAADGPRKHITGEAEKCKEVRDLFNNINWDCELHTLFRDENLGCGVAMSSAISWFFDNVEAGIILEDDCLPDQSFFGFCGELLERYKDDNRIMMISGDNLQNGKVWGEGSYYFSAYPRIWGWATWKRAWEHYDFKLEDYDRKNYASVIDEIALIPNETDFWLDSIEEVLSGRIDSWDYQWVYTVFKQKGLCIVPYVNLVKNLGLNAGSHIIFKAAELSAIGLGEIGALSHPSKIERNLKADKFIAQNEFPILPTGGYVIRRKFRNIPKRISLEVKKLFKLFTD